MQIIVLIFCLTISWVSSQSIDEEWQNWKKMYGSKYRNLIDEEEARYNFEKNNKIILEHNEKYKAGELTWEMGHNQFSTWSDEEYELFLKFDANPDISGRRLSTISVPSQWKPTFADNRVWEIPIKNQGSCTCCTAFCGAGLLEHALWKKYKTYFDLSEQHLYDCVPGGRTRYVYDYALKNGVCFEKEYVYTMVRGNCQVQGQVKNDGSGVAPGYFPSEYFTLPNDEFVIAYAVEQYGWVSVPINGTMFKSYRSGIMPASSCQPKVNHAVIIVGYGTDPYTGLDYWLIRNSWGQNWGEGGYMKLQRNANACDILNTAGDRIYFE